MSKEKNKALRFGVLANDFTLKKWQYHAIQQLIESGLICEVIILSNDSGNSDKIYRKNLKKNFLYRVYQKFFLNVPLLENMDARSLFTHTKQIKVAPIMETEFSCKFSEDDVKLIRSCNLDFVLRFGFNIIHGEVLNSAKYGIWSFHHDDDEVIRGGPPGFWEILHNHPINGIVLQRITDNLDKGFIIKKAGIAVISHSYSTHLNELLQQGLHLLDFVVQNLQTADYIDFTNPSEKKGKIFKFPENRVMIQFLLKLVKNKFLFHWNDLFRHEKWSIGISTQNIADVLKERTIKPMHWIPKSGNRYFEADPFVIDFSGKIATLLFENFDYKSYKGDISRIDIDDKMNFGSALPIIKNTLHYSFPLCYKSGDTIDVFPENCVSSGLKKYSFDQKWKFLGEELIIEKDIVDPVFLRFGNTEWLFCGLKKYNPNNYLFLFFKDENGKYVPHPKNPVVLDTSCARMAGNFIYHDNCLYRPAQKNNLFYGQKIRMQKVEVLTKENYNETFDFELEISGDSEFNSGAHTLNFGNRFMVFDAKKYVFVWYQFIRNLKRKLKIK